MLRPYPYSTKDVRAPDVFLHESDYFTDRFTRSWSGIFVSVAQNNRGDHCSCFA